MDYLSKEMPTWFTKEQKRNGIDGEDITLALLANWDIKRPIWVIILIETYTKTFIQSVENPALDVFLTQLAIQSGKNVGAVETAEDQCAMLNHLNNTLASFYIFTKVWLRVDLSITWTYWLLSFLVSLSP